MNATNFPNSFTVNILANFLGNGWSINTMENFVSFGGRAYSIFSFTQYEEVPLVLGSPVVVIFFMAPTTQYNPLVNLLHQLCNDIRNVI